MTENNKFILEERPQTEVYTTSSGFIGIKQVMRGEETIVLFTVEETRKIIEYLKGRIDKLQKKS